MRLRIVAQMMKVRGLMRRQEYGWAIGDYQSLIFLRLDINLCSQRVADI
jgi:hypothetical protein